MCFGAADEGKGRDAVALGRRCGVRVNGVSSQSQSGTVHATDGGKRREKQTDIACHCKSKTRKTTRRYQSVGKPQTTFHENPPPPKKEDAANAVPA